MEYDDRGWTFDLKAVRSQVQHGNYAVRPHAMQHAVKEGFSLRDMVHAVLYGLLVEEYPQRQRGLVYADGSVEEVIVPLHVVCEHRGPDDAVDFVTAVGLTVALDIAPGLAVDSPEVFPYLSLTRVTVLALRSDHRRRLATIQGVTLERKAKRQARRQSPLRRLP